MNNNPFITLGNVKIRIEDLPEEAWEFIVGGDGGAPDLRKYFRTVAWLNRAVKLRKNHVQQMPFRIYRGETEVDTSEDYQNALGFLPNIKTTLGMIEQGLTLNGREYQFIERRAIGDRGVSVGLRHLKASSIKPKFNKEPEKGSMGKLIGFERKVGAKLIPLDVDDVLYFWYPDDNVEIGEPEDWPALAALQAAGILSSVGNFAQMFFERGAIKVTLLTTKENVVEGERSRIKAWWDRVRGNAWSSEVVNAEGLEVIPVGEGLESLNNKEFTKEQREDISTALGVPHSMLFSNAANYATSQQDKMNFYEDTIIPECNFISEVMNDQLLEPLGYRIVFDHQELPIFQEDEEQRSAAFYNYVASQVRPSIAGEILGIDLPDGVTYSALDEKYELSLQQQETMANAAEDAVQGGDATDDLTAGNNPRNPDQRSLMEQDLEKWERKALKRIDRGYDPACQFESEYIPLPLVAALEGALEATTNKPDLVRSLFADTWVGYP